MGKNQWVVPTDNGWGVRGENNSRLTSEHRTKEKAIKEGIRIAKNQKSELFIKGLDGKIQNRNSYGNDPCPPRDKKH